MDTPAQALEKLKHFCSYRDRAHSEVKDKLKQLGIREGDANDIMATLITGDYLNEERFARSFARGKFRIKKWGRKKIIQALKSKNVSPYCIRRGLEEIDEDEYRQILARLASDKYSLLKNEQYLNRKYKTMQYLLAKGYEADLVGETVRKLQQK
jgi:regulatory protein